VAILQSLKVFFHFPDFTGAYGKSVDLTLTSDESLLHKVIINSLTQYWQKRRFVSKCTAETYNQLSPWAENLWWVWVKKFWPGLGKFFVAWVALGKVGLGQPALVWVWKFPLKIPNFSIFSLWVKKYLGQRRVSLLFTVDQKYARVGSGLIFTAYILFAPLG